MSSVIRIGSQWGAEQEALRRYEGVERIFWLPLARMIAVPPAAAGEDGRDQDPVYAWIEWRSGFVERPVPGSALWRAVLIRYLANPVGNDPTVPALHEIVQADLERFPDIESWLHWADHERKLRSWLRRSGEKERPADWAIGSLWPW